MIISQELLIEQIKESSSKEFLKSLKESNAISELFYKDIEEITEQEMGKIKGRDLNPLIKLQDQTDKMIEIISKRFYLDSKQRLFLTIDIYDPNNEVVSGKDYLDNMFKFIESSYHKSYYHLLFIKNNLGFIGADNFVLKEGIAIPWDTQVFIETRAEIVQKIVTCFSYWDKS